MALDALSQEEQTKLYTTINEAIKVKQEMKDLNDGLKDVITHVAEELNIQTKDLNRAVRIAFKQQENSHALEDEKENLDTVEEILYHAKKA